MSIEKVSNKINSVEGLRAVFAISIFLNHCNFLGNTEKGKWIFDTFLHNGGYGVSFFFVLSGFCIYLGYSDTFISITKEKYVEFIVKRIKKIWPLYMLTMVWAFLYDVLNGKNVITEIAKLILSASMLQTLTVKYWGILNSAAWFVSCVCIIYLITPFILNWVKCISGLRKCKIAIVMNIVLVVSFEIIVMNLVKVGIFEQEFARLLVYVFPGYRVFYYVCGIFLAKVYLERLNTKRVISKRRATAMEILVVILVAISYLLGINGSDEITKWKSIFYLFSILSLIYYMALERGDISKFLGTNTFIKLGKISMEIFLFHYVIIYYGGAELLSNWFDARTSRLILKTLVLFGATVGLALCYEYIVKLGKKYCYEKSNYF